MSRYAESHKKPEGPGDGRPTALQIIRDEDLVGNLADKVFVVTGISSGIGIETTKALYATGGHVFGTARDTKKAQKVIDSITTSTKGGKITLIEMELGSLASVKKGAEEILKNTSKVNVLINNAGVMATPEGKTEDGFETQFGTNHLAHFYLFQLLKPALLAAATPEYPSRVVSVSSIGHRNSAVRFEDVNFEKPGTYDQWTAYGQSKTANIHFSNELERRYGSRHLHSTSLHPGGISSGLGKHIDPSQFGEWAEDPVRVAYMKNAEQGAATSVYAAVSAEWANKGGKYLSNCVVQGAVSGQSDYTDVSSDGYAAHAYDEAAEQKLWIESLKMVGMKDDQ